MIQNRDIVKFRLLDDDGKMNSCEAARFCAKHQMTAQVVTAGDNLGRFVVDAGLGYAIYASPEELDLVVAHQNIPVAEDD